MKKTIYGLVLALLVVMNLIPFAQQVDAQGISRSLNRLISYHLLFSPDNTYDIGASGATRPRNVYAGNNLLANSKIGFENKSIIKSPSDSVLTLQNGAEIDFGRLQFGGTTSSFPSIARSTTTLRCRLADDSGDCDFTGRTLTATSNLVVFDQLVLNHRDAVTVDGATTFSITTSSYIVLACTGAETINTITGAAGTGAILYLENSDTECTIADDDTPVAANAVNLTGSANDVGADQKVITLIYNGSHWLQIAESDN